MDPPPLSLAALTILDAGPAGQIRAAAEAGFKSVGLRLMPLLDSDVRIVGDARAEQEIEELLRSTGLAVLEVGVFPIKAEMDWRVIEAVIRFSGRIGARHLVCPVEDRGSARRAASLARLCDLASVQGLDALVEFNPYSACTTLGEALELVGRAGRSNAALVIDALHLSRSGGDPGDFAGVPPDLLRLLHLCDAWPPPSGKRSIEQLRAESRTARLLPGEGSLWLERLLAVLPAEIGISIEAPSAAHAHLPAAERARRAHDATRALMVSVGRAVAN
jgi:sugar phosphate isomerase/epimerase